MSYIKILSFCIINLLLEEILNIDKLQISKVKIPRISCPTKKCTLYSCRKIKNYKGYIVLKEITESKTYCKNGSHIWNNIYKLCNDKADLKAYVSGIHFAISVHIAYNYYSFIWFYYHNINVYIKSRKYFHNFMLLFLYLRKRLKSLFVKQQIDSDSINICKKIIEEIGCLDCQKCQILGSLQFYGLLGIIRLNSTDDLIYAILLYKKLLRTFKMISFLESLI